ncbi:MAG: zinc-dependent alcohol dehydrogenase family protein [Corynebacterium sp.]|uniref:zinc-dependent alcohol dehydrogenase family protein n=1 Tax=Actinomycetes TaxID=1760 RepID=UPI002648CF27|nr:zinc-dependent alcohol dehydrogenase family protein [Corynebacterium sp.]MDN5723638.1 zinc-dependent alcohol dehydrogenase family protein [Corynebacterium sp.]MDN5820104.1 zinc-dependent alcohol dehydrogenase family protein [Brachybacterium sp.]MDN5894086.1 zinc-dependent alcohol dehydrogenase family protein [Nocardioides sp.]
MKAMVYRGAGKPSWEDVPEPELQHPTDVVAKILTTTICGTDLHILKGDVPAVTEGRILGHEGIAEITEVGDAVTELKVGDKVIISAVTSCGKCSNCRKNLQSHCLAEEGASGIGWIFGHLIDGTQAEYVRIPFAESSVQRLPEGVSPEDATMISDILPTGHELGILNGNVKAGDVVIVIGAGPVGLAAITASQLYGPSRVIAVDLDANRVEQAKKFGATDGVLSSDGDWKEQVLAMTDGLGVDVAIEAVGIPATWNMCLEVIRAGGHVANVGVHGTAVELPLQDLWIENLTFTTGLVSAYSAPMLTKLLAQGRIDVSGFISHRFAFSDFEEAYEVFSNAAETKALKVIVNV